MRILYIAFVYNELPYIEDVVSYYKKQGLDIYIIDNMSTDGTYEWLIENKIRCSRFDTNESFDLTLLQKEVFRVIMEDKPDWIVYGSADLYYVFDKTIKKTIIDAEKLGCNQISTPCYGALNTGEDFKTPLYKTYFHGMYYRDLQMISKFDEDLQMNGDNIIIPDIKTYNAPGMMVNYGACKPIAEQRIKLERRQKAWDNGLSVRTGKHFKWGESNDWKWNKEEYLNFHKCEHKKYFKKLYHENTIEKSKEYYNAIYKTSDKYKQDYSDIIYLPIYVKVLRLLNRQDRILELGCGSGHLAHLLKDNDYNNYVGVDFSAQAIDQARKRTDQLFVEQDVLNEDIWINYDTIVSIEMFEHLDYASVLKKLNKGAQIIFSVPNFIIDSHLYCWQDEQEIRWDFEKYISINSIEVALTHKDKKWFLVNGFIK
jgi:2-polyprenyl-3-methyl-5-hydroxy-6-metoxy-1,4-benzoquinol methylase